MKKSKKQHYVPRFYLERFIDNNDDSLFALDKNSRKIFKKTISEICVQNYYYSFKEKDIEGYNYVIEDYLSKKEYEFSIT
jgi:hypothetical protein